MGLGNPSGCGIKRERVEIAGQGVKATLVAHIKSPFGGPGKVASQGVTLYPSLGVRLCPLSRLYRLHRKAQA